MKKLFLLIFLPALAHAESYDYVHPVTVSISTWSDGAFYWMMISKDSAPIDVPLDLAVEHSSDSYQWRFTNQNWEPSGYFVDMSTMDFPTSALCKTNWLAYRKTNGIGAYTYIENWKIQGK